VPISHYGCTNPVLRSLCSRTISWPSDSLPEVEQPATLDHNLKPEDVRVLGALLEKAITTPDYYPMSLNALVNACNQKTNREPVMEIDEDGVRNALHGLQQFGLAGPASGADSRVTKYEHRIPERFNLGRREEAIFCVLLLRGPQTPGELRGRTERMFRFEELDDVQSTLQRLMERVPPLVRSLPRQPGTKEIRYVHLLADTSSYGAAATGAYDPQSSRDVGEGDVAERVAALEQSVSHLQAQLDGIRADFAEFRKQFE
jgi:uncharacterized protein